MNHIQALMPLLNFNSHLMTHQKRPSLDSQGTSPGCFGFAFLNAKERQKNADYTAADVFQWYQDAGISIDNQQIHAIAKKMKEVPLAGHKLKKCDLVYARYFKKKVGKKYVPLEPEDVWNILDPKKNYVIGVGLWKSEGKLIPIGDITWNRGNGTYNGDILKKVPDGFHIMAFWGKRGDASSGDLELENSWKRQHMVKLRAKDFLNEVWTIHEVEFE